MVRDESRASALHDALPAGGLFGGRLFGFEGGTDGMSHTEVHCRERGGSGERATGRVRPTVTPSSSPAGVNPQHLAQFPRPMGMLIDAPMQDNAAASGLQILDSQGRQI